MVDTGAGIDVSTTADGLSDGAETDSGVDVDDDAVLNDAIEDAVGDAARDVQASDSDGGDTDGPLEWNACGGEGILEFAGEPATPGASCGVLSEGTLVCNGANGLRCAQTTPANACGGAGLLPREPGADCGCGGVIVCALDGGVECVRSAQINACGGCLAVEGRPGFACDADGMDGIYVCVDRERLECVTDVTNACGGGAALEVDGSAVEGALPGGRCDAGDCGTGRYVCSGTDALRCEPDRPCNSCGGPGALAGVEGESCGQCGEGVWACSGSSEVVCDGAGALNSCGGCGELSAALGTDCTVESGTERGSSGITRCGDGEVVCASFASADGDAGGPVVGLNDCGGTTALVVPAGLPGAGTRAILGADCGSCAAGVLVCAGTEAVVCTVNESAQQNACGGCDVLAGPLNGPCGTCGSGSLSCSGTDALSCNGDLGEEAGRNACGGCGTLPGTEGNDCGRCLRWVCDGDRMECAPHSDGPGCRDLITCADLPCGTQNRTCIESDGVVDAACGQCNEGFEPGSGDACVAIDCGEPPSVDNATARFTETTVGATVTYVCALGFAMRGTPSITCSLPGQWGTPPACDDINECEVSGVCTSFANTCQNTSGSWECSCADDYNGTATIGGDATCIGELGTLCREDEHCPTGSWCPTNTLSVLRRCSPREFAGTDHEMDFVFVPSGTFEQGPAPALNPLDPEAPATTATLTRSYWVGRTEVTQAQWRAATGGINPSCFQSATGSSCSSINSNDDGPVESAAWSAAVAYANWLSTNAGLPECYSVSPASCHTPSNWNSGHQPPCDEITFAGLDCPGYRLLTESEWERAARAGTTGTFYWGEARDTETVSAFAWFLANSDSRPHGVGQKLPNAYGLFDMLGNVREFVWDLIELNISDLSYSAYPPDVSVDYLGLDEADSRGRRGGSYESSPSGATSRDIADEGFRSAVTGFRLARTVITVPDELCPLLDSPRGGRVSITSQFEGATAVYTCDEDGPIFSGSRERTCQGDGTWTGSDAVCLAFP